MQMNNMVTYVVIAKNRQNELEAFITDTNTPDKFKIDMKHKFDTNPAYAGYKVKGEPIKATYI